MQTTYKILLRYNSDRTIAPDHVRGIIMTTDNPKATEDKTNENCSKITNLETQETEIIDVTPLDLDQNSKAFGDKNGDVFEQVTAKYYEATSTISNDSSTVSPGDNNSESDVRNNTTTSKVTATAESTNDPVTVIPDVIPVDEEEIPASQTQKIKGAAQMAAGGALAVAGVPLLILPGPQSLSWAVSHLQAKVNGIFLDEQLLLLKLNLMLLQLR